MRATDDSGRAADHRWAPAHLSQYVDLELTVTQRRRMERHLEECPDCLRAYAELEATVAILRRRGSREYPAPAGIVELVRAQLDRRG